jgi:dolichol-phosphate mannosyltransferase
LKTTLIIPTYNEVENIPRLLQSLFDLPLADLHVLIVDDASPDGTGQLVENLKNKYPHQIEVLHRSGKLGLGTAYIQGFQHCLETGSDLIGQMDADFSHSPLKVVDLLNAITGHDMALGSRYVPGGSLAKDWALWRKGLSTFGNFYARTILHLPIRDVTGGFRLWKRGTLSRLPLDRVRSNGYVFQVEMAYITHRCGFTMQEIPIHFAERKFGKSKMSLRIQLEAAVRVWQLRGLYRDLKPLT